jgi:hypothetical protein
MSFLSHQSDGYSESQVLCVETPFGTYLGYNIRNIECDLMHLK